MDSQIFPSSLLFFFFFIFFKFVNVPISMHDDDYRYSNCSLASECGDIKGITYPFWGNGRPDYCGHPGFELHCVNNASFEIDIMSQRYRVVGINPGNRVFRIARMDLWNVDDYTLCDYSPSGVNLTWFYDCTSGSNRLSCQIKYTYGNASFEYENVTSVPIPQNLSTCNTSFVVPILQTGVERLKRGRSKLGAVLREGLDVNYIADVPFCKRCENSGGRCGYNQTLLKPICFCPDQPQRTICFNLPASRTQPNGHHNSRTKIAIAVVSIVVAIVATSFVHMLSGYLRKNFTPCNSMEEQKSGSQHRSTWKSFMPEKIMMVSCTEKESAFLRNYGSLAPKRYRYSEVQKMANSFKDKLSQGVYGVVFKGKLPDGRLVAVKVLSESKVNGEEFINEVTSISKTFHVNIISLLGFCLEGHKRALVYEFMPNGSLEKFVHDEKSLRTHPLLGWEMLYKIAIGIAQGLEYLHHGCHTQILHFDIKPHNIFLDQEFCPKISGFELAQLCPVRDGIISMMCARGTPGYIAPKLEDGDTVKVSHKSDVYSYGMTVLEMVSGKTKYDVEIQNISSEICFPHWAYERLDKGKDLGLLGVTTEEDEKIARKMILVSLWCIQFNPSHRPSMKRVLDMLEGSIEALRIPPLPDLSSP